MGIALFLLIAAAAVVVVVVSWKAVDRMHMRQAIQEADALMLAHLGEAEYLRWKIQRKKELVISRNM